MEIFVFPLSKYSSLSFAKNCGESHHGSILNSPFIPWVETILPISKKFFIICFSLSVVLFPGCRASRFHSVRTGRFRAAPGAAQPRRKNAAAQVGFHRGTFPERRRVFGQISAAGGNLRAPPEVQSPAQLLMDCGDSPPIAARCCFIIFYHIYIFLQSPTFLLPLFTKAP